jgi:hypothetical protein
VSPEEDALRRALALLDHHAIPYMLTGSVAASFHGRPRATHNADVVIDPDRAEQLEAFVSDLLGAGFHVNSRGARQAFEERRQFNAIEMESASKIDFIVRKDRPFSRTQFGRRRRVDLAFAAGVAIVSPEDAVVSKLEWAKASGDSERQLRDAANVVEMNPALDRDYIGRWAATLGLDDLWRRVQSPTSDLIDL